MNRKLRHAAILAIALTTSLGARAQAQYGYGWGPYGGGGQTPQGDMARGMGVLAAGAGEYNAQTAAARSVNADTAMRYNQYLYESQMEANRKYQQRVAKQLYGNIQAHKKIADRLRNNPEPRDITSGEALNSAFDEINDPRVYTKTLASANVKIGGETIRDIPFKYGAAAISTSIHQITQGGAPASLKTPTFEAERNELKALAARIREKTDEGEAPEKADLDKAQSVVDAAEAKVAKTYPENSKDRNEATRYLKSVRGLLKMMDSPALDLLLSGVENRREATLGELLMFMNAFNLRFGPATTPRQRFVYEKLYPEVVKLRSDVEASIAALSPPASPGGSDGSAAAEVFSRISPEDLKRRPSSPPPPPAARP